MNQLCFDKSNLNKSMPLETKVYFLLPKNFIILEGTIIIMTISTNILVLTSISVSRCQVLLLLTQIDRKVFKNAVVLYFV